MIGTYSRGNNGFSIKIMGLNCIDPTSNDLDDDYVPDTSDDILKKKIEFGCDESIINK